MLAVSQARKRALHGAWLVGLVWLLTSVSLAEPQSQSAPRPSPSVERNRPCDEKSAMPQGQPSQRPSTQAPQSQSAPRPSPSVERNRPCDEKSATPQSQSAPRPSTDAARGQEAGGGSGGAPSPTAPQPYTHVERRPYPGVDRGQRVGDEPVMLPSPFSSWRPYTNDLVLVTLGMTKGEVLLKAGNPAFEEVISQGTDGHLTLSTWTYIRTGFNASVTTLTFQGGKLVRIENKLAN